MARSSANPLLDAQNRINRAMVDGVGGLQFTAQAPPGVGRLIRIPFYLTTSTAGFKPLSTSAVAPAATGTSTTVPAICAQSPNESGAVTAAVTGTVQLQTPQISWATLRIVGFEVAQKLNCAIQNPGPILLVQDLKIGGGANLFTHEDYADADIYSADQPEFCGLRDYPILKSPNTAVVTVQMLDDVGGESMTVSCSLLCEVLVDDNYGAHVPGPYARAGALVRQGGSFVNR